MSLKNALLNFITRQNRYKKQLSGPYQDFVEADGDTKLRLDYDLDPSSLVFDVGGYEGQWSNEIHSRYSCKIHIFEPVREFCDKMEGRFANIPGIQIHCYGLAATDSTSIISLINDGSSIYRKGLKKERIELRSLSSFVTENKIMKVDLMKINIEGGEYELLESIIDNEIVNIFDNIQVQFHLMIPNAVERRNNIHRSLEKTHFLTYEYPFIWENWKRKS